MDMKERLQELAEAARKRIEESDGPDKLNEVKVAYLGKKGELTAILKSMKDVAPEDRPKVGQMVNETRAKIEEHLEATRKKLEEALREEKMKSEVIDVTLPAKKAKIGHRHPNSIALEEVEGQWNVPENAGQGLFLFRADLPMEPGIRESWWDTPAMIRRSLCRCQWFWRTAS